MIAIYWIGTQDKFITINLPPPEHVRYLKAFRSVVYTRGESEYLQEEKLRYSTQA